MHLAAASSQTSLTKDCFTVNCDFRVKCSNLEEPVNNIRLLPCFADSLRFVALKQPIYVAFAALSESASETDSTGAGHLEIFLHILTFFLASGWNATDDDLELVI